MSTITHINQGDSVILLSEEIEVLEKILSSFNISSNCIDKQQSIISFPQSYVGYINLPTRKILIEPKHIGVDLRHILRIHFFLYSLQNEDFDEPIYDLDSNKTVDILKSFIFELSKVVKRGLPVSYKYFNENIKELRGNLDLIKTTINLKLHRNNIFCCNFDDLSLDVPINQLLLMALVKCENLGNEIGQIKKFFINVSLPKTIPNIVLNTNTMYCKKAVTLAYMILNNISVNDFGEKGYGNSFLVNFDKLFEDFVKLILTKHSGDFNFTYWDNEKPYASCFTDEGEYTKSYIPDLIYNYDPANVSAYCILDMKNKVSMPFNNADVYQMFFYANQLNCKKVILCYPSSKDRQNARLSFGNESFFLKRLEAVYINIAGDTALEFKNNIINFIEKVKSLL